MDAFTRSYERMGLNRGERAGQPGVWYREWAPGAQAVGLVGEFNAWDPRPEHWATKGEDGVFELFLPDQPDGAWTLPHRCAVQESRARPRAGVAPSPAPPREVQPQPSSGVA